MYLIGGECIKARAPHPNSVVVNNILHSCGGDAIIASAAGLITTHDYNVFFAPTGGNALNLNGAITRCANIAAAETHSKCVDPRFVNTSAPYVETNFKMHATAAVIGAA